MVSVCENYIRHYHPELSEAEVMWKKDGDFATWVKDYVKLPSHASTWPTWVHELVNGPDKKVTMSPMYFTRGYLFHTQDHGRLRKTCNYGVCVKGANYSEAADEDDFYGIITDIIEFTYGGLINLKITLFKCEWFDPTIGKGTRKNTAGGVDVLARGRYNSYEPFILASQADQVCYIPYPYTTQPRQLWLNVCKVNPRGNISGYYRIRETPLLQQENNDDVPTMEVEDIVIENLANVRHDGEDIDADVGDAEQEDEFQCNMSSSDDEDDYDVDVE